MLGFGYSQSNYQIFVVGGQTEDGDYYEGIQSFNQKSKLWIDLWGRSLNIPQLKNTSAIYLEKYNGLLFTGGLQISTATKTIFNSIQILYLDKFNIAELGTLPNAAKKLGIGYYNDKVFFFGGSTSMDTNQMTGRQNFVFSKKMTCYNLKTGELISLPDLPFPMETSGGIVDGKLYTVGGYNGESLADVWQYDIQLKNWEKLQSLPKRTSGYAVAMHDQFLILVGDYRKVNRLVIYDTKTQKSYYFKTNLGRQHMGASVVGNELHVYGGITNNIVESGHYKISLDEIFQNVPAETN